MNRRVFALLVADDMHPLEQLIDALREVSVDAVFARTCEEAERLLTQTEPHIIFTATAVSDGSWLDVIILTEKASISSNVIVVSQSTDVRLYVSAIECGAYDFMVPPFERGPLSHIVRSAWLDVQRRRQNLARAAAA